MVATTLPSMSWILAEFQSMVRMSPLVCRMGISTISHCLPSRVSRMSFSDAFLLAAGKSMASGLPRTWAAL